MHKAPRHSFHTRITRSKTTDRPRPGADASAWFVNGKLLAEGEVLQDDRLMTFSKEPNRRNKPRRKPSMVPDSSFYLPEKSVASG